MLRAMRRSSTVVLACLVPAALVVACKKNKTEPPSTTITPEPSASTVASSKPMSAANGPLKIVAVREGPITLGQLQDGNVFAASGIAIAIARGNDDLARDAAWAKGLYVTGWGGGFALDDVRVGGSFPGDAWLAETTQFGRGSSDWNVAHYEGSTWKSLSNHEGPLLWFYASFGPWKDGKTIALRLYAVPDQGMDEGAWAKLEKELDKTTARFEIPTTQPPKADPSLPTFAAGAHPSTFASLSSGDAVAVVSFGSGETTVTKVQRWTGGDTKGVVEALPGLTSELMTPVVAMGSASSAWVGGNDDGHAYLAHFDGKAWARSDTAMKGIIASIAEASDGTTWIVAAPAQGEEDSGLGELWKRAKDGKMERVALPKAKFEGDAKPHLYLDLMGGAPAWKASEADPDALKKDWFLAPRQVVVSASGEPFVMAVATDDEKSAPPAFSAVPAYRSVVLRTRGVTSPLTLPPRAELVVEYEEATSPVITDAKKAKDDCNHFFVVTGDVPDGAPADYDPKELRAALASIQAPGADSGTAAYEVRMEGKRRLGIYVPLCIDDCKKAVDDLVATLAKKLPSKPTLYCRTPLAVRDLNVTFAKSP
jgi:hypothetical protein